jgi:hypothetical protein
MDPPPEITSCCAVVVVFEAGRMVVPFIEFSQIKSFAGRIVDCCKIMSSFRLSCPKLPETQQRGNTAAGAKALVLPTFSARLKSCPDTKLFQIGSKQLTRTLLPELSITGAFP